MIAACRDGQFQGVKDTRPNPTRKFRVLSDMSWVNRIRPSLGKNLKFFGLVTVITQIQFVFKKNYLTGIKWAYVLPKKLLG